MSGWNTAGLTTPIRQTRRLASSSIRASTRGASIWLGASSTGARRNACFGSRRKENEPVGKVKGAANRANSRARSAKVAREMDHQRQGKDKALLTLPASGKNPSFAGTHQPGGYSSGGRQAHRRSDGGAGAQSANIQGGQTQGRERTHSTSARGAAANSAPRNNGLVFRHKPTASRQTDAERGGGDWTPARQRGRTTGARQP